MKFLGSKGGGKKFLKLGRAGTPLMDMNWSVLSSDERVTGHRDKHRQVASLYLSVFCIRDQLDLAVVLGQTSKSVKFVSSLATPLVWLGTATRAICHP